MSAMTTMRRPEQSGWSNRFIYGLLVVQIIIGFEFLWSALTKIVRGGFVSGLAADLTAQVTVAPSWYASFAHHVVIPHSWTFGYLLMAGELFVGVAFIVTAIVWLSAWDRVPHWGRMTLAALSFLAALGALSMNLNYHIANGALNPWQLGRSPFAPAVDIDTILTMVDVTLAVVMGSVVVSLMRTRQQAEPAFEAVEEETASERRLAA